MLFGYIFRNCRRSRRKQMLLERQEEFTEFEPDTKPGMSKSSKAYGGA